MANKRISTLDDISLVGGTSAAGLTTSDIIPVTDVSDTTGSLDGTTKKVTVANLVAVAPQGDLESANNLSDLNDAATARTNLGLRTAATTASTDYATSAQGGLADTAVQPAGIANMVETTDSIDVLSDVDTSTVAPTPNDLLKWNGTNFVPGTVSVDVDTPLTTALRGTDNPHIGAYSNQSFKVMDNPDKSAMVIADADGNVTYLLKGSSAEVRVVKANGSASRFALASDLPAFVLENDTGEPDIEVSEPTSGEKISVISGDSDSKGANGLPIRQGYNIPDIGASPAPLLISGGTIA